MDRAPAAPETPERAHQQDTPSAGPSSGLAPPAQLLVVAPDDALAAPHQEPRAVFFARLRAQLDQMVEEETKGTAWAGRPCPWVAHWIERYRLRPVEEIGRALSWFLRGRPPPLVAAAARTLVVEVARGSMREWMRSGKLPTMPPQLGAPALALRRLAADGRAEVPADAAQVLERLGPGVPLDAATAARFEPSVGGPLTGVRLHTDSGAAEIAASIGAHAFSVGADVGFGAGAYRPGTPFGDAVLAHELAHATQPAGLSNTLAERDAHRASAAVLGQAAPPARRGAGGLSLRRCSVSDSYDPNDVDLGYASGPDAVTAALEDAVAADDAQKAWTALSLNSEDTGTEAARRLRLKPDDRHGNKLLALQYVLSSLSSENWHEAERLLGLSPLTSREAIVLSPTARKLFDVLFDLALVKDDASAAIEAALDGIRAASPADLELVLQALTRTYSPNYGNRLHTIQAVIQQKGSDTQYRDFVRLIHATGLERGLDEADPVLAALVETEVASIKDGKPADRDTVLALFGARARELAMTMLRESEGQIVRVLSRTEGKGAPAVQVQFETEKILTAINDVRKTYLRDASNQPPPAISLRSFETVRPDLEAQARSLGVDASEESLRRAYDRQVQITLHLIAAPTDKLLRDKVASLTRAIDKEEAFLRGPHIVEGQNPVADMFTGPAGAWQRVDAENQRIRESFAKVEALTPQRDFVKKGQLQLESALPLLGGLPDSGLSELSKVQTPAAFDRIRDQALARILGNVEKVRKDLISGDLNVWMIEKVVARTKTLFGIEDPPGTEAQKAWAAIIDARVAGEKADATRVRDFLEILNTAALIVSLGAALFTGGGSLALYAGIAGAGIGVGSAVYDLIDTQAKLDQAAELYGSGLNQETRLSDAPPEWRFLYAAWLNLGINAVLALFMIKGLGKAASSALRGEEAVVEKEVRALAKRLRARGVAMTEDELVAATMQALREEGMIVGAMRGASVYRVSPSKVSLLGGPGRSLEQAIDGQIVGRARLRGATLAKSATPAAAADESAYTLTLTNKAGATQTVSVNMRTRPTAGLAPGPHGAESGPARLLVSRDATGWKATIEFDQGLHAGDLPFAAGHELDELADLVYRRPTASVGDIARETRASYFQPAGVTRTATGRAVPIMAHDAAAAEELKSLMNELNRLKTVPGSKAAQLVREQQIDKLMKEMGLDTPAMLADRAAALEKAGLDPALIRRLEARAAVGEFQASKPLSLQASRARGVTVFDEDFVQHVIDAERKTGSTFVKEGIGGCHVTAELQAFEKANPQWAFELEKTKAAAGTTFRRYKQWLWKGSGAAPTSKALRPGGSKFNPADWISATPPKTTADSLQVLLSEGEDAWGAWHLANPAASVSSLGNFGSYTGTAVARATSGIEFSGYFSYLPATSTAPARWRLRTLFVDGSWF
ncbi:MAG: DUF4157 domain-containing protein [Myxococcota bacterium]